MSSWVKTSSRISPPAWNVCCLEQHELLLVPNYTFLINKGARTQTHTIKCGSLYRLCRIQNVFPSAFIHSGPLSSEWKNVWTVFSSAGRAAVDKTVAAGGGGCLYTLVSSPFMSTEQWSLSLCSLLWCEEWACFFFSIGRTPSSSWIRRATSGERWSCLLPGGGGW